MKIPHRTFQLSLVLGLTFTPLLLADTTVPAQTVGSGQTLNVTDPGQVTTSGSVIINSGGTAVLQGGTAVKLEPGFSAFIGSSFHAQIYGVAVITSPGTAQGMAGSGFIYQATGSNTATYSATGLPTGLTLNSATGLITGTLPGAGLYYFTLKTTNSWGTYSTAILLSVSGSSGFTGQADTSNTTALKINSPPVM